MSLLIAISIIFLLCYLFRGLFKWVIKALASLVAFAGTAVVFVLALFKSL